MPYSSIHIIYNPVSTGDSQEAAAELKTQLKKYYPKLKIELLATKYAGHAQELAYKAARNSKSPLIISSSGDGGYNEVINGAMRAQAKGARPICAVLPAGNANDHSRTLQSQPLIKSIKAGGVKKIDLLKASLRLNGPASARYAHSYIGLGLTPVVAVELNKTNLNALKELLIVVKTFYKFRPFKIMHSGNLAKLDSILFANIGQMAKILTVSKTAKVQDGAFEVIIFPHQGKLNLLSKLAKATTSGLEPKRKYSRYKFKILKKMPIQFDGEVQFVSKNTEIEISAETKILRTII